MTKRQESAKLAAEVEAAQLALQNTRIVLRSSHMALCAVRESLATAAGQLESIAQGEN